MVAILSTRLNYSETKISDAKKVVAHYALRCCRDWGAVFDMEAASRGRSAKVSGLVPLFAALFTTYFACRRSVAPWMNGDGDHVIAKAEFDFQGASNEELTFQTGDKITLAPRGKNCLARADSMLRPEILSLKWLKLAALLVWLWIGSLNSMKKLWDFNFILLPRESNGGAICRTNPDSLRSCLCFRVLL